MIGVGQQHVVDFLDGGVDDEGTANQDDDAVQIELAVNEFVVEAEDRILEKIDNFQQHEQQNDAQDDGQADPQPAHPFLLIGRCPTGFEGNVEQIVDAEYGLQENEREEGDEVFGHWREGERSQDRGERISSFGMSCI